jgi:hypothetical protein
MRKGLKILIPILLLAAGAVLCVVRWQAWFGMPIEPQWTGDTQQDVFVTFAQDSVPGFVRTEAGWQDTLTPQSLDILLLGDIHNGLQKAEYDTLAARVPQADIVAQVGDWMDRGQNYYRQLLLREWTASELYGTPVINCPGNHEYSKGIDKQLSPVWSETFPQPDNGPIGVPGKHYYVDFPNLRFIVIDTNPLVRLVHLTRVLTWLRTAMYTAGDRYVVVMMHHPVFSVAKGRFNSLIYTTFRHALGEADLAIAGHDHSYMRRSPFVVLNTSGRPKTQHIRYATDITSMDAVYGVLSIERTRYSHHPSPMVLRIYRLSDGQLIDNIYVSHD